VYDLLGREIATLVNELKAPGTYSVLWNAADKASGVYFYRLKVWPLESRPAGGQVGDFARSRMMLILK